MSPCCRSYTFSGCRGPSTNVPVTSQLPDDNYYEKPSWRDRARCVPIPATAHTANMGVKSSHQGNRTGSKVLFSLPALSEQATGRESPAMPPGHPRSVTEPGRSGCGNRGPLATEGQHEVVWAQESTCVCARFRVPKHTIESYQVTPSFPR